MDKATRDYLATIGRKGGRKGGKATAAKRTPEERSEAARKAVLARWAKKKKSGGMNGTDGRR